jgi:hypothetical protein
MNQAKKGVKGFQESRSPKAWAEVDVAAVAYLAGIIDGEGTIGIYSSSLKQPSPSYNLQVLVTNCDAALMMWLVDNIGGTVNVRKGARPNHRSVFRWRVYNQEALALVEAILPYLVIKRAQAELALRYRDAKWRDRPTLKAEMHVLNRRGA